MWLLTWEESETEEVVIRKLLFKKHSKLWEYANTHDIETYEVERVENYEEVE